MTSAGEWLRFAAVVVLAALAALISPLPRRDLRFYRAPYGIAKTADGAVLRLAMVHDVLHERYLRHGDAWHLARAAACRTRIAAGEAAIAAGAPVTLDHLDALDDLAVSLERLGHPDQAIPLMRSKLELLPPALAATPPEEATGDAVADDLLEIVAIAGVHLDATEHHRYTALANLGTFLVHEAMPRLLGGDSSARPAVIEGLGCIRAAMTINPAAHFGRETWQTVAIEHLLHVAENPVFETGWSMIGDALDDQRGRGRAWSGDAFTARSTSRFTEPLEPLVRAQVRSTITRVGIDPAWAAAVHPSVHHPKPFDEPVLALLGMWTMGGGPNPRSALALARIMESIDQPRIAWTAYERASELGARWSKDEAIRDRLLGYCRHRQDAIAARQREGGDWQASMRKQHRAELAYGTALQREHDEYEARRLAEGVAYDADDLDGPFLASHPAIATVPQHEDSAVIAREAGADRVAAILAAAGAAALLAGVDIRRRRRAALAG